MCPVGTRLLGQSGVNKEGSLPWDDPSPGLAYLPSLTSGIWPSSVTTCGRSGRRCRSPSASLILPNAPLIAPTLPALSSAGFQNHPLARGNDVQHGAGAAMQAPPLLEIGTVVRLHPRPQPSAQAKNEGVPPSVSQVGIARLQRRSSSRPSAGP